MNTTSRLVAIAASIGSIAAVTPATAQTTYSNTSSAGASYTCCYGTGKYSVPIVGQLFTAPGGTLQSWTFYDDAASPTGATFAIAAWNGTTVAGPDLFDAAVNVVGPLDPANPNSGYYAHTVAGINLTLTAGQSYLAYYTTYNTPAPLSSAQLVGASTSPLGGGVFFSSTAGPAAGAPFSNIYAELAYTATFGDAAAAVPEAATWAMMIVGFGAAGCAMRRRTYRTVIA